MRHVDDYVVSSTKLWGMDRWIGAEGKFYFIGSDKSENGAPTSGLLLAIEGWSLGNY